MFLYAKRNIFLACLLNGAKVKKHSWVCDSIIGWKSTVGAWVRMEGLTVLGEDVQIKDELFINGTIILPHKSIGESQYVINQVIM
jgi:mannose-1-phosphate guanylyltransferase